MGRTRRAVATMLVVGIVGFTAATTHALTNVAINACLKGKLKAEGTAVFARLKCYAKATAKGINVTDPTCLQRARAKMATKFAKLDEQGGCPVTGDASQRDANVITYANDVDFSVGQFGSCDAGKTRLVGKFVAAKMQCYVKAARRDGVVDAECVAKAGTKLVDGIDKLEEKPTCSNYGQSATLRTEAEVFVEEQACYLNPENPECDGVNPTPTVTATRTVTPTPLPTPTGSPTVSVTPTADPDTCGNGVAEPGEPCDQTAPPATWAQCGADFPCVDCNCGCPTRLHLGGDALYPNTIIDLGWNGIGHRMPLVGGRDVTLGLSACSGGPARPCGVCAVSGPIANTGIGEVQNQRCSGDLSVQCSSAPNGAAGCGGPLGLCQFHLGPPLPISSGGISTCFISQFTGTVSGTADTQGGAINLSAPLDMHVYTGFGPDTPCPRCVGDAVSNDGVQDGTCSAGARAGLACDGNGATDQRADFGTTSFDCPPGGGVIAVLPIVVTQTTGTVTRTVTSASPRCSADASKYCLCDTCNNGAAQPCAANADCPPSGGNPGICGGRRCIGGGNDGGPCGGSGGGVSACPGGSCARPGEPTKPNACFDDCATIANGDLCVDVAPTGDQVGECTDDFYETRRCSLASGHPHRSCSNANQCCDDPPSCVSDPATPGECELINRSCFLDNGLGGSIVAVGMADTLQQDASEPTLASVFCTAPTTSPAVNASLGLPGPARLVVQDSLRALP